MDQTYSIPESDLARYEPDEFLYETDEASHKRRKRYPKGAFIFRLAGRDREKSASYYTPEVLTACVVKYSLKELLGQSPEDENSNAPTRFYSSPSANRRWVPGRLSMRPLTNWPTPTCSASRWKRGLFSADDYRLERQKVKAQPGAAQRLRR